MSTGLLYHGFGVRGYRYVRTKYVDGGKKKKGDAALFPDGPEGASQKRAASPFFPCVLKWLDYVKRRLRTAYANPTHNAPTPRMNVPGSGTTAMTRLGIGSEEDS